MRKLAFALLVVFVMLSITVLPGVGLAAGPDKGESIKPEVWPQPITNPSKAVPFSHPDESTVNPKSPLYNPKARYGPPGTRFGPPGQRVETTPLGGGRESGHRWFGTAITTTSNVNYTYAHNNYHSSLSIPSGTTLYAPTLLGTNDSPLEILSRYWWDGVTLKREIAVYNHETTQFEESTSSVSDYLSSGFYAAEILLDSGTWYAMLYNFDDSQWETWESQVGGSGPDPYGRGWDVWEEWNFDEGDWPDLGETFEAKEILINIEGSGDAYVTSSHGSEAKDVGSAPYSFAWTSNYYRWYVDADR